MRTTLLLLISLFGISCLAEDVAPPSLGSSRTAKPALARYSVDLAKPGALDRLEESNPDHYAKVMAVTRVASRSSCVEDLKVLRVELNLDDATCAAMTILTSEPPKRNVSVTIEGVRYMTFAAFDFAPAKVTRVRPAPKILPAEP